MEGDFRQVKPLLTLKISRFVGNVIVSKQCELLVFCDASMKAYAGKSAGLLLMTQQKLILVTTNNAVVYKFSTSATHKLSQFIKLK